MCILVLFGGGGGGGKRDYILSMRQAHVTLAQEEFPPQRPRGSLVEGPSSNPLLIAAEEALRRVLRRPLRSSPMTQKLLHLHQPSTRASKELSLFAARLR